MAQPAAEPVCAFGWPSVWHHNAALPLFGCQACAAECRRLQAEFWAAVARGEFDAEGYTPAERRAKERRSHV